MEESNILDDSLSHENRFRLAQGFCYFAPDALEIRNNRFSFSSKHKASFMQWFSGIILPVILVIGNTILAYRAILSDRNISLYVTICCWVLYVFFIRVALRPQKIFIAKNSILLIKHNQAIRYLSKGYFVIKYLKNEKEHRTILILPGVLNNGMEETEKALSLFKENNYPVE